MSFNPKQPVENEIKGQGEKKKPNPNSNLIVNGHISSFSTPSTAAHSSQSSFDIFTWPPAGSPRTLLGSSPYVIIPYPLFFFIIYRFGFFSSILYVSILFFYLLTLKTSFNKKTPSPFFPLFYVENS